MFIDTHTHIYTTEFDDDREEVISRAVQAGAQCLLLPNIDLDSISPMLNLYEQHPDLCRPMMGLHPTELPENPEPLLDHMERLLEQSKHPFVAIGEVGIDLYWDNSRCMEQIAVLRRQAEYTPMGTEMSRVRIREATFIPTVRGRRSRILSMTGLPSADMDTPKSKCTRRQSQSQY